MSNLFRRLRIAWTFLKRYPVVALPPNYWNDSDAKALSNFMTGDTGSKLRNMRFTRVYQAQQNAICDRKDAAYSAGIAFGILGMVREEDDLLRVELPQPEDQQQSGFQSVNR